MFLLLAIGIVIVVVGVLKTIDHFVERHIGIVPAIVVGAILSALVMGGIRSAA
ncbi:hypothetical protein [Pseudonocardia endophytica]|uniref:Uncharacterized protein n=1 Tax=Pseudonocardia endophytica TaxID=401976 RepID=A0A4R1HXC0_PSEEN|nr:hypothetical protein [Pseudonocardia endophytica]TCK27407.1 hypothetical protein EV378_3278 [Pseudonocardia endophytica]